jgi:hypothetical protein
MKTVPQMLYSEYNIPQALMEIIKHGHEIHNTDHKFTHTELWNFLKLNSPKTIVFRNYRFLINSDFL